MRFIKAMPIIAILALAACGEDQQTAETETTPPPATETPAAPVTGDAPPAGAEMQAASPTTPDAAPDQTAAATSDAAPAAPLDSPTGLPQSTLPPPPTPSSSFSGTESMAPPDPGAAGAVLADAPFEAGTYSVGDLTLELSEDGNFTFTRSGTGETITGDFRVYGDMMTFSNVGLDVEPGVFPMTCRVQRSSDGFLLTADGPSCSLFDGQTFERG